MFSFFSTLPIPPNPVWYMSSGLCLASGSATFPEIVFGIAPWCPSQERAIVAIPHLLWGLQTSGQRCDERPHGTHSLCNEQHKAVSSGTSRGDGARRGKRIPFLAAPPAACLAHVLGADLSACDVGVQERGGAPRYERLDRSATSAHVGPSG